MSGKCFCFIFCPVSGVSTVQTSSAQQSSYVPPVSVLTSPYIRQRSRYGDTFCCTSFCKFLRSYFLNEIVNKNLSEMGFLSISKKCWQVFFIFSSFFGIAQYCVLSLKSAEIFEICQHLKFQCFQYLKWSNWCEFHGSSLFFRQDIPCFFTPPTYRISNLTENH